jgi:hypothetical protein
MPPHLIKESRVRSLILTGGNSRGIKSVLYFSVPASIFLADQKLAEAVEVHT